MKVYLVNRYEKNRDNHLEFAGQEMIALTKEEALAYYPNWRKNISWLKVEPSWRYDSNILYVAYIGTFRNTDTELQLEEYELGRVEKEKLMEILQETFDPEGWYKSNE